MLWLTPDEPSFVTGSALVIDGGPRLSSKLSSFLSPPERAGVRVSADRGQKLLTPAYTPLTYPLGLFRSEGLAQLRFILGWEGGMENLGVVRLHGVDDAIGGRPVHKYKER